MLVLCELKEILRRDLLLDTSVQQSLPVSHVTEDFNFLLGCNLLLNVALHASEHEWLQNRVESLELVLVELTLVHGGCLDIFRKPLLELLVIVEQLGHDKVKKGPELGH